MRHILLTGLLALLSLHLAASTIFVTPEGTGKGTSWSDATGNLIQALLSAKPGDQVFVSKGTYYPTSDLNRQKSFIIPSGVKVYGGFAGFETSPQQRELQYNKTVLSGNIGSPTDRKDNSFTVVFFRGADEDTLLDGFIITGGYADGSGQVADRERCGAGVYLEGAGPGIRTNPVISNCTFQRNEARDGGAAYLNGRGGECNAVFINCQFLDNKVDLDGGAVFNDGRHGGQANPRFISCTFSSNEANYGGAMCNYGGKGESSPEVRGCVFRSNEAYLRGGAIFNMNAEGIARPVVNDSQFVDNKAVSGKGIYTFSKYDEAYGAYSSRTKLN